MRTTLVTVAPKTKLLTKSTFRNYDLCLNPYVGCEFKCQYCYVRFFIKDKDREWGDFVRIRDHMHTDLSKELQRGYVRVPIGKKKALNPDGTVKCDEDGKAVMEMAHENRPIGDSRLVIGTMTDPYQPKEVKFRITRSALTTLTNPNNPQFKKVGIFTRSPLVLQDIDLIKQLPNGRVHVTITPFPDEVTRVIEPLTPPTARRWEVIRKLKEAGIRVHVNVAPIMPGLSESLIEEWVHQISELAPAEYFVDPMQPYSESYQAFANACKTIAGVDWSKIEATITDNDRYLDWKNAYRERWEAARVRYQHLCPDTLPIWSDHEHKVWVDMRTGVQMSKSHYGDEAK